MTKQGLEVGDIVRCITDKPRFGPNGGMKDLLGIVTAAPDFINQHSVVGAWLPISPYSTVSAFLAFDRVDLELVTAEESALFHLAYPVAPPPPPFGPTAQQGLTGLNPGPTGPTGPLE